jgi:hypothetical protein
LNTQVLHYFSGNNQKYIFIHIIIVLEENLPTWFLILILIVFTINIEYTGSPLLLWKQSKIYFYTHHNSLGGEPTNMVFNPYFDSFYNKY